MKFAGQSKERDQIISAIEDKISDLEAKFNPLTPSVSIQQEAMTEDKMKELIISFLSEYQHWPFSPLRMEKWGADKKGYSALREHSTLLRRMLRKLVAEGQLETSVSKKGNTLYRIKA